VMNLQRRSLLRNAGAGQAVVKHGASTGVLGLEATIPCPVALTPHPGGIEAL